MSLRRLLGSAEWRFLRVMRRADRRLSLLWWGLIAVRGALPALLTIAIGALVAAVQQGDSLAVPLTAVGIAFVAVSSLGPVHDVIGANLGARTSAFLHDRLMEATTRPPGLAHLEDPDLADELAMARDFDIGMTGPDLATSVPNIGAGFAEVAGGFGLAAVLAGYRWWAPLVMTAGWLSTHVLLRDSSVWKIWVDDAVVNEQRQVDYAYRLAVAAPAAKEVRLFGLADWVVDRFATRRRAVAEKLFEARRLRLGPLRWGLLAVLAANALVFWSLARDATAGELSLASLVVFAQATIGTSALAFGDVDWWFRQSAQPVPKVLGLAEKMGPLGALTAGTLPPTGPTNAIEFRDVTFGYGASGPAVLEGFNLTIRAGSSLAVVGQNGAGKTTLAKLLCRLYDPRQGAILVDGVDLREIDVDGWRSRLAAVFQDFVRYELPLRDNVAPGGGADDDVQWALEQAHATGLADLDTVLARGYEGGTDLSGGQWQRVALARALHAVRAGARVVILDEPTAQLDVRGEAEVFDRILDATRGLTTILVSHRFSTVRHADQICVVHEGRVVEIGSHDELMARGGRYRTMFELQASRFDEDDELGEVADVPS